MRRIKCSFSKCPAQSVLKRNEINWGIKLLVGHCDYQSTFMLRLFSYQTVGQRILWIQSYNLEYFKRICNVVILTENYLYFASLANALANSNRFARFCWTLFVVATVLVRVIDLSPFQQQQQQQFKRCMAGSSDDDTHPLSASSACVRACLRCKKCVRGYWRSSLFLMTLYYVLLLTS